VMHHAGWQESRVYIKSKSEKKCEIWYEGGERISKWVFWMGKNIYKERERGKW